MAITGFVIAYLYPLIQPAAESRGRVLVTGVEGEQHQLGATMVFRYTREQRLGRAFLGIKALEEHQADILGVSATMLFSIPKVVRLIESVRAKFDGGNVRIIVGGAAFRTAPDLYREIGAQGCALNLRSAVQLVTGLA